MIVIASALGLPQQHIHINVNKIDRGRMQIMSSQKSKVITSGKNRHMSGIYHAMLIVH